LDGVRRGTRQEHVVRFTFEQTFQLRQCPVSIFGETRYVSGGDYLNELMWAMKSFTKLIDGNVIRWRKGVQLIEHSPKLVVGRIPERLKSTLNVSSSILLNGLVCHN
jgi:hypothetical protein